MCIAVTIAAVAKKVLEFLLSNKKGRKFLGYVIGIAVFVVLLPLIVLIGLFGWLSGGDNMVIENTVVQQLQAQYAGQFPEHEVALEKIAMTFRTLGISSQAGLAQTIYISSDLPSKNTDDTFYSAYADCFLNVSEEKSLTDNITEAFGIEFSDKDKADIAAWVGG